MRKNLNNLLNVFILVLSNHIDMISAAVQLEIDTMNREIGKKAKQQVCEILCSLGVNHTGINLCVTNGISLYTTINGVKVRISDHSVTSYERIVNEAHVSLFQVEDPEAWASALCKCCVEGYGKVVDRYDMREFDGSATAEFKPSDIVRNLGQVRVSKAGKPVYRYQVWTPMYKSAKI